ncbi:MAG: ATP-binding cassette domain-containing protein [Deltaproteobacteria bacterium]|nr:ATP-binding cassette domain-containing protein [Deltaproteobacteria bacterium]
MIRIEGLTKRFGTKLVLDSLDFSIPGGQITALIGPSGSGKSVLSKCVAGLLSFDNGSVIVDNCGNDHGRLRKISYVFQFGGLLDFMTVLENVVFPKKMEGQITRELLEQAISVCEDLNIVGFCDDYPKNVPLSVRKLAALARAIISDTSWIFIDEPDSGLDPEAIFKLYQVIVDIFNSRKKNVVIISHDVPDVFKICSFYGLIYAGKIVSQGEIVRGKPSRMDAYIEQFMEGSVDGPISLN